MKRNVLVTGGTGYIGSHIVRALQKYADFNIAVVDRVERIHTLKQVEGFFNTDYVSPIVFNWLRDAAPDYIVHCAGTSLVGPSVVNPGEYYENNVSKTIQLLEYVRTLNKKPVIIFSSSASVYGNPKGGVCRENSALNPISPYGRTKLMIEQVLEDYANAYGIRSIVFRYFNAAGAEPYNFNLGQEPGATHIVAKVLEARLDKTPFVLNGMDYDTPDHTCVRDYVHVWDIALAHILAMQFMDATDQKHFVLNLGTNQGISNKQILDYVQSKYGAIDYSFGPRRPGDPDRLVADPKRAGNVLGWYPTNSTIEKIVDSAHEWYLHRRVM
jgi:UDP-glucose-4-epimerase GalE